MKFGSGLSTNSNGIEAAREVCAQALGGLDGGPADIAILFISRTYADGFIEIRDSIIEKTRAGCFIGCTCQGIIGRGREVEDAPALSLLLGKLPGVKVQPVHVDQSVVDGIEDPNAWKEVFETAPEEKPALILLPDPFTMDVMKLIEDLNQAYPNMPVMGGMASGAVNPGENTLFFNDELLQEGAVGMLLTGNISVRSVVSQGCRPIGEPFAVTEAKGNVIHALAGEPALTVLEKTFRSATPRDQALARGAVFVGRVIDEYKERFTRGDFLIRSLMGVDRQSGALVVSDLIPTGETVQFHVRDAESAHEDLELMLKNSIGELPGPMAALIFSCNGRGSRLFTQKDHDAKAVKNEAGPCPQAGFFCAGEIGPIGGKNFVHGFTSSIALFYSAQKPRP